MKKIYDRTCILKTCKNKFTPSSNTQRVCSFECSIEYAKEQSRKEQSKIRLSEKRKLKESIKGIKELKKELEIEINTICRLIDKDSGCISCGGHTTPQAGHYHTVQANGSLRFNLLNVHLQDYNCNCAKGGNIHQYDLGLIKTYGKEYWEMVKFELPNKYPILKPKAHELKEWIVNARQIVKELKKIDLTYPAKVRVQLREQYNLRIGIYA